MQDFQIARGEINGVNLYKINIMRAHYHNNLIFQYDD